MAHGIKHILLMTKTKVKEFGRRLYSFYMNVIMREIQASGIFSKIRYRDSILVVDDNIFRAWNSTMTALMKVNYKYEHEHRHKNKQDMTVIVDFTGTISKKDTEVKKKCRVTDATWLKAPIINSLRFNVENNEQIGWLLKNLFTSAVKTSRSSRVFLFGADEFLQSKAGKEALRFCLAGGGSDDRTVGRELCWKLGFSIVAFVRNIHSADEQVLGLFDEVTSF